MDDLSQFCCQEPACADYGKRGAGNLTVCDHYGPHGRRLLYCSTCKARFSERKGTVLFAARLPDEKALSVLDHLSEGCGARSTARLTGVNLNTVLRYSKLAGGHTKALHDELVAFSPSHARDPVGRKMEFRRQEAGAVRPRRSGRRAPR